MDSKQLEARLYGTIVGLADKAQLNWEEGSQGTVQGEFDPPETILNLADLVDALLPAGLQLPAALPRIELTNLAVRLTPDSGEFSFQGDAILALGQTFTLAGIRFSLPSSVTFNVSLVREGTPPLTRLTIGLSLPADAALTVSSNLAWARELAGSTLREVQNDEKERQEDLVSLGLSSTDPLEMTLVEMTFGPSPATIYFSDIHVKDDLDKEVELGLDFALNVGDGFDFPFLKQDAASGGLGALSQRIAIGRNGAGPPTFDIDLPLTVYIGDDLAFEAEVPFTFDLGTFALSIDHEQGVHFLASKASFTTPELLGLSWTFAGAQVPDETRYHYLTLVTKDLNYQLQLAPGAHIDLAYGAISREPIVFRVSEFVLSSKGLTLTAGVTDTPVRLNGLDTKFRFQGSQLRIVENKIQDLTVAGSGPLPPDLVGDAVADVALQFKQVEGGLRLVSGGAQLRGQKPLSCKATRFQFSLDALGLKFVYDQKFHLYFTLSGQAKFVPAPADDPNGPLSWLPEVTLDLVDCPLTGDASVIAQHIEFLVDLPKPLTFSLLGAFDFELRAIGFQPQCEKFEGRGAMLLSGQVQFAQGKGDIVDPRPDFHKLYIGLPPKGQDQPQVDMGTLPVGIKAGQKFKLSGSVAFKFESTMQGFKGDGVLEIKGLPPMAASFGFMRVRRDADAPWLRAWFIYLEVRQVSFQIPVLQFYIREVGLGFGYRFTLVAIKRADEANDLKQLIRELKVLSRTQGDLSKQDRWAVDLEGVGEDPRWTIVLRAMISQLSAAPSPLTWDQAKELSLSNTYLFDAIVAVRSDLTFFMAVRGWLNTNYATFVAARNKNQPLNPLFSGFVFLWPREKRFLAHLASDPDGHLGTQEYPLRPSLPPFVVEAIRHSQFSATLLIEPALMHFELGWPNMLRWSDTLGPLTAELCGGFIFRITPDELVVGVSFLARAWLRIEAGINLGLVGASLTASADAAFGARYIGVIPFQGDSPVMYGAVGLELFIAISLSLWIKIPLLFTTLKLSFRFNFSVGFTAGLEFGLNGLDSVGLRGRGTVSLSVMGHSLHFGVDLSHNPEAIAAARQRTEKYLSMGLEATDVESELPGIDTSAADGLAFSIAEAVPPTEPTFSAPGYSIFVLRSGGRGGGSDEYAYFVLLPQGETEDGMPERGFLPVPPAQDVDWKAETYHDFRLELDGVEMDGVQRFDPHHGGTGDPWLSVADTGAEWSPRWTSPTAIPANRRAKACQSSSPYASTCVRHFW
jgi:hypothetical protein